MVVNGVSEFETSGEIVEFDPPRTLTYSWFANFHSDPTYRSIVRWELTSEGGGTLVKMTHSGLKGLPDGAGYAEGWPGVVDGLVRFFAKENESAA